MNILGSRSERDAIESSRPFVLRGEADTPLLYPENESFWEHLSGFPMQQRVIVVL